MLDSTLGKRGRVKQAVEFLVDIGFLGEDRNFLLQPLRIELGADLGDAVVEAVAKAFGRIDILVNNAGINRPQPAEDVTEDNWDQVMNTNLKGLFFCAQAVGRVMISQKKGKIINISSDAGTVGIPGRAAYCASKGGVNLVTKVLAIEWAQHHINVNAIAPAFIETPLTEPMLKDPAFNKYVLENTPLGRVGKPKDVSSAAVFLAAKASDYMTGHILLIDGDVRDRLSLLQHVVTTL